MAGLTWYYLKDNMVYKIYGMLEPFDLIFTYKSKSMVYCRHSRLLQYFRCEKIYFQLLVDMGI